MSDSSEKAAKAIDLEGEDGEAHDNPTSVARVPEALLRSLRRPAPPPTPASNNTPTAPPPPAPPVAAVDDAPPDAASSEEDDDNSATAVLLDPTRERLARGPAAARSGPNVELFAPVTEESPDEDPSETLLAQQVPVALRSSSKTPAAKPVGGAEPAPGPQFEPPPPEMMTPRPPPTGAVELPRAMSMHRPVTPALAPAEAPATKSRRGLVIALVAGALAVVLALAGVAAMLLRK